MEIVGFVFFLLLFVVVGLWSTRQQTDQANDYLLAGGTVSPLLTALSAAATKNSGYMFIGLIGYIYSFGLSAIWLVCGFLFGDFVAFCVVHKRLRQATKQTNALSFAELIGRWNGGHYRKLQVAIGLITLVFLSIYAAAQLNAGGKALKALFEWHPSSGAWIGAGLTLVYCMSGGLRASIWTDAAQSLLMMFAMLLLLGSAIHHAGGSSEFFEKLDHVSPTFLDLGPSRFGSIGATVLFAIGWLFNGIGVIGQPQVMVRFMALDDSRHMRKTGIYYFLWSSLFLSVTFVVGLASRLYIAESSSFDAELALPTLAQTLLPGLATGIVLGGIFAATISTIDSQVLSCSAVVSDDFNLGQSRRAKRLSTLAVMAISLTVALFAPANVFTLVIVAWSALACTIGPLVIVHAFGKSPSEKLALLMMILGLSVVVAWRFLGWNQFLYEGAPGILLPLLTYALFGRNQEVTSG
ncbi:MAG: sodium/proline symporter [Akkermansiaceae bacterium]